MSKTTIHHGGWECTTDECTRKRKCQTNYIDKKFGLLVQSLNTLKCSSTKQAEDNVMHILYRQKKITTNHVNDPPMIPTAYIHIQEAVDHHQHSIQSN